MVIAIASYWGETHPGHIIYIKDRGAILFNPVHFIHKICCINFVLKWNDFKPGLTQAKTQISFYTGVKVQPRVNFTPLTLTLPQVGIVRHQVSSILFEVLFYFLLL